MSGDLDRGRRLARRRMAWVSFLTLVAAAVVVLYGVVLSEARTEVATAVSVASGVLNGLFAVFTTIVVAYIGASAAEKVLKKTEDQ